MTVENIGKDNKDLNYNKDLKLIIAILSVVFIVFIIISVIIGFIVNRNYGGFSGFFNELMYIADEINQDDTANPINKNYERNINIETNSSVKFGTGPAVKVVNTYTRETFEKNSVNNQYLNCFNINIEEDDISYSGCLGQDDFNKITKAKNDYIYFRNTFFAFKENEIRYCETDFNESFCNYYKEKSQEYKMSYESARSTLLSIINNL